MKKPRWYHTLLGFVLMLGSGALYAQSMKPHWAMLGWVAFLPLLIGVRFVRPGVAALFGLVSIVLAGALMAGKPESPTESANALFLFLGLAMLFITVPMFASYGVRRSSPILWTVFVASAAVGAEWLICYLSPVSVALSQSRNPYALGLARFTGIWGVSFLIWLVPAAIVGSFAKKKPAWPLLFVAALALGFGRFAPHAMKRPEGIVKVAAVQTEIYSDAAESTKKLAGKAVVAVWPEYVLEPKDDIPYNAARESKIYVVASVAEVTKARKPYSSAVLIGPDGEEIGSIRKRHLYGREVIDFYAGMASSPVKMGDVKVGMAICYDTVFTDVVRELTRQGAELILVPTGDPVVSKHLTHRLHQSMVAFRAAENGVPIVWADGHALSTIFDSRGNIVKEGPIDRPAIVEAGVEPSRGGTLFTRLGDYFAYLSAAFATALGLIMIATSLPKSNAR